ncbi:MAG: type I restriction endonuclease subunit R [Saprospiraceae bacterium]|nr:type I restriction endonuclease subunit R [Saprospiraceae bacterium]
MTFNEDSRVKIPAIQHLCCLGYEYLSLSKMSWDKETNIFPSLFEQAMEKLNPGIESSEIKELLNRLSLALDNEDLGQKFYDLITSETGHTIIDFEDFGNNLLHVVTELPFINGDEEFRPDIVLLINGLPLVFVEVKKPNNHDGIQAEYKRMTTRFENKKFRKFVNITQLMVFSNNMPYDDTGTQPLQGAFYATTAYGKVKFNFFREEDQFDFSSIFKNISEEEENRILLDNNLITIKHSSEYLTNKNPASPTHSIFNSLFQPNRLAFLLKYGIAYVKGENGLEKHIMRYPQLFATKAIEKKLDEGAKSGIIWHTQGSGKTALAYHNVKYLTHYFRQKGIVPKFYFIVDRLDLAIQAGKEFKSRGLIVHKIHSREDFVRDLRTTTALHNSSGKPEITVVNIHKFENDPDVISNKDYNIQVQRVYFLDEVHRSYNPKGSFLANLKESDVNAIRIGLTGTPLLGDEYNSRALFGDYIHKYYYNASIADGYTLRLIREEIETSYHFKLKQALEDIEVLKGKSNKKLIYADAGFVRPMLEYIVQDFEKFRLTSNDPNVGGMVICDSSEQAEKLKEIFDEVYAARPVNDVMPLAADTSVSFENIKKSELHKVKSAALILHDAGTKEDREDLIDDYKEGKIDFLFVYNMLLTGFDASRLKKLYITRVIKAHNLLQALTRVNRSYKDFKYGYVVDFADIQSEFDKTNRDYFDELQRELGSEMEHYSNIFKTKEEIHQDISQISEVLFHYDTNNAEKFSQQVSQITDKKTILQLSKALNTAKELYNLIRLSGQYEMLEELDFRMLSLLARIANDRLALINAKDALENDTDVTNLLRVALEDVLFTFRKVGQEEMIIADKLKEQLRKTREILGNNFDHHDPVFISLREELERMFKKKNLSEITGAEMLENIKDLELVYEKAKELERKNQLLKAKYENDAKYARVHKRLMEKDPLTDKESKLFEALNSLKKEIDEQIRQNAHILENESFVEKMVLKLVIKQLKTKYNLPLDAARSQVIQRMIVTEYMNEFHGRVA